MINSITIRNIATYNDEGISLKDMNLINLIYGSNGTGKSTISKVVADISSYSNSSILWKNDTPLEILAYNKDFCEKNYNEVIPGVFTLGEVGNAIISDIETKRKELDDTKELELKYQSYIDKQESDIELENKAFKESAWNDVYKKYEQSFPKSIIGAGTKDGFKEKIINAYDKSHTSVLSIDELVKKADVLFAKQPSRLEKYPVINASTLVSISLDPIWSKIIVGKQDVDIAGLISRLGNSDWISRGVKYIEGDSDVCPFCQQHTITEEFRSQINSFFDETYKKDLSIVSVKYDQYKNAVDEIILSIEAFIESVKSNENKLVDVELIEKSITALKATCQNNIEKIASKLIEPSRVISFNDVSGIINGYNNEISKANTAIAEHNQLIDNYSKERTALVESVWSFFATVYASNIATYKKTLSNKDKAIANLVTKKNETLQKYTAIRSEIIKLENSVTSVTPAVNEINRLLKAYGFTNFLIQEIPENKNHYQIVRENGEPAKSTLSEGESTFITFLYYMQLVKGSLQPEGITSNRILVIDDPVSSLDSNVLFVVSTLLRDVFTEIHNGSGSVKQVIILTHNVYFHKEIAFLDKHCKWRDNINHWVLRKKNNISSIQDYKKQNPIKSSYELMWTELKSKAEHSCIVVQNIMRRIIENYFMVLGGVSPDVILNKFDTQEERAICKSLLSWVNDGSHSLPDDLYVEMSDDQLERNTQVFKEIFHRMGQDAHYEMMMQMKDQEDENSVK